MRNKNHRESFANNNPFINTFEGNEEINDLKEDIVSIKEIVTSQQTFIKEILANGNENKRKDKLCVLQDCQEQSAYVFKDTIKEHLDLLKKTFLKI